MLLDPRTLANPSGTLPEILHRIMDYLNSSDLLNLKEAGNEELKEIVDESISQRERTCKIE